MTTANAVAVVVTYNRLQLLVQVIEALLAQTVACDIVLVDNCSTDGTEETIDGYCSLEPKRIHYIRLQENVGGAGGFEAGLQYAMSRKWNWFWLMDDDAVPENIALEKLQESVLDPKTVYGSVAVNISQNRQQLCWPAIVQRRGAKRFIRRLSELGNLEEVDMIPFLGLFIHRSVVKRIGYPDPGFFICADDKEYCERIKTHGGRLRLVKSSRINHPLANIELHDFGFFQSAYRSLPPWKTYYDVRNKIFIAKMYYGARLWTHTLPGIIARATWGLLKEQEPKIQLAFALRAIRDGLLGRKGKRIEPPQPKSA